jgi:aminocarboxymuconate-semialdehyde decarboxylase
MSPVVDIHSHILAEDTIRLLQREAPSIGLKLQPLDSESVILEAAGVSYRPFPRGGFDLERRLRDMDETSIDMQVLSATPQTYFYNQDASLAAQTAALQNDRIAATVAAHPKRFIGIATLPMQAPDKAVAELKRAMRDKGLRGAMIGSNVNGKNLDDPALAPFWAAAEELRAFIFIHPVGVAGADRLKSYYLVNLIGNPVDTTIAAASLIFGGVLDRHPKLTICLAHGGGFVPYQGGRWVHGWKVRPEPQHVLKRSPEADLSRFLYDTITHSDLALEFLVKTAGAGRVLLGSDYPFDMGLYDGVTRVRSLSIPDGEKTAILGGRALDLLGVARK